MGAKIAEIIEVYIMSAIPTIKLIIIYAFPSETAERSSTFQWSYFPIHSLMCGGNILESFCLAG